MEQVKKYQYLGQLITEDGRCEVEIKRRIEIAITNFLKMRGVLTTKRLSITTRKKLLYHSVMSTLMYVAETWTIYVADMKKLEAFEMWCFRKMLRASYKEHLANEDVLKAAKHKRSLKSDILKRKTKYLGHGMQRQLTHGVIEGGRGRGRPRHTWLHNINQSMGVTYG